jgi:putative sterol carrier protein
VPRFLSPEWAAAFDAALVGVTVPGPDEHAGLAAIDGRFTVVQEVSGTPDGDVSVRLVAHDGSLRVHLDQVGGESPDSVGPADVTIALAYDDALAMAKGQLAVAEALSAGRIRVRGDLSVLVASQQMLAAAQPYVKALAAATTY